ncbi:hypothetical protein NG799_21390 [Laspinema sp. D1]|uniref:Uncharacterized protein n=1 Tax=Laspinema palackyanum D2a TaxID=2953684 RepID=A0ABT2MWI9_9CYAN|nr:hypothetical protein [Laspinema sp. D2b]MCT7968867.1 hypothetical protein [Laspinema sp. D2a]
MKFPGLRLISSFSIGVLLLTLNILSSNAQKAEIKQMQKPELIQSSSRNNDPFKEELSANAQKVEIKQAQKLELIQISPPNYDPLKEQWTIVLEASAYGLQAEYAKKLLGPHMN